MDPLGLALENFNALGRYRTAELDQPIDSTGILATGEAFSTIKDLKRILATERQTDFYRCITEKIMTYALGRAVEYTDAQTVDDLVAKLEANDGKASTLIYGIIHSNAFQRVGQSRARRWRRSRSWQRHFSYECSLEQKLHQHQSRHFDRPGDGQSNWASHAVPVA